MNMIKGILNFVKDVIILFADWLSFYSSEWAWCPVRVDNRIDRF